MKRPLPLWQSVREKRAAEAQDRESLRELSLAWPGLTPELVKAMSVRWPDTLPTSSATHEEVLVMIGQASVWRHLEQVLADLTEADELALHDHFSSDS